METRLASPSNPQVRKGMKTEKKSFSETPPNQYWLPTPTMVRGETIRIIAIRISTIPINIISHKDTSAPRPDYGDDLVEKLYDDLEKKTSKKCQRKTASFC